MTFQQRVEQHHVVQFGAATQQAVQQMETRLRQYVTEKPCTGETSEAIKLFDKKDGSQVQGRTPRITDNPANRRRRHLIYNDPYKDGELITDVDLWRQAMDPTSMLQQTMLSGANRYLDDVIVNGILGPAMEGKTPKTAKNLGAPNTVDKDVGGANSGMNVDKLIGSVDIFGGFDVYNGTGSADAQRPVCAVTMRQMTDLLNEAEIRNRDTGGVDRAVLRQGWVNDFLGMDFVMINRLPLKSGTTDVRYNPVWFRDNIMLGVWQDITPDLFNVPEFYNQPYAVISCLFDAVRLQEEKTVRIECVETAAA